MAKQNLPVNYKDDVMSSAMGAKRRWQITQNTDGTYNIEDVTTYDQVGSDFGAGDINATNEAVNQSFDKSKLIRDMDAISALTKEGYAPDALALKEVSDSLGFDTRLLDGVPQWSERGADSWNFFSSPNSSDVAFGMVYQYGTGDHVADVYSYNDNVVSITDNVITFKRSGTINVQYGIHCDNGKDFAGYCLNSKRTDFGTTVGMYEMELKVSKGDTLYFLSSNTATNRRTTLFGFVNFI